MPTPQCFQELRSCGESLIGFLNDLKISDHRGPLATLRAALSSSEKQRMPAWRILARFGGIPSSEEAGSRHHADVVRLTAGLFTLPNLYHSYEAGNFGASCRTLLTEEERKSFSKPEIIGPVSQRVQHLLAADRREVGDRVLRLARRMSQNETKLNFVALYQDLNFWGSHTKAKWAGAFWNSPTVEQQEEEVAP